MRIQNNVQAFNAFRNLSNSQNQLGKSLEKLSSGYRINRAADDAAGLVTSENLRAKIGGLQVASRNAQDGISVVQTAEGALTEVHSILGRMRDLAVQAANTGGNTDTAIAAAQDEMDELTSELDRIFDSTKYGDKTLFDPEADADFNFQVGADSGDQITLTVQEAAVGLQNLFDATYSAQGTGKSYTAGGGDTLTDGHTFTIAFDDGTPDYTFTAASDTVATMVADIDGEANLSASLDADGEIVITSGTTGELGGFTVTDTNALLGFSGAAAQDDVVTLDGAASTAIDSIDTAIGRVSELRGQLGAFQNRMESTIRNLGVATENLTAAESRIRDADMALETVSFTKNQVLQQAGVAMLAQANVAPQSVLRLLG